MKKSILLLPLFLLSLIIFSSWGIAKKSDKEYQSKKKSKNSTIKLFNGKDLDGWYTFIKGRGKNTDPKNVFTVNNGQIRISGEEYGCITSNEEFANYKIILEFKWGEMTFPPRTDKARDSGLLLNSVGEDGASDGTWMHSIEFQIIEGGTGDFIVVGDGSDNFSLSSIVEPEKQGGSYVYKPGGKPVTIKGGRINWFGRDPGWKDVKGFRGTNDIEKPVGKWNRLECIVRGKEIFNYLNGKLVNYATDVNPQKGKIQIQSEGAEIFIRRVEISLLN